MLDTALPPPLSASVDWFSASLKNPQHRQHAKLLFAALAGKLEAKGEKRLNVDWKGYALTRVGDIRYGERQDDDYCELQGAAASEYWLMFQPLVSHVARIDLAVTWRPKRPIANLAHNAYLVLGRLPDRGPRPPQLRYWETWAAGQTFYLGSVKSDVMARLYDKGVQLGTDKPGVMWRFEVQYRNRAANAVAESVAKQPSRGAFVAGLVAHHYRQRYYSPEWAKDVDSVPLHVHRPVSSIETLKRWLAETVEPAVTRLRPLLGDDATLELLGLSRLA